MKFKDREEIKKRITKQTMNFFKIVGCGNCISNGKEVACRNCFNKTSSGSYWCVSREYAEQFADSLVSELEQNIPG